MKKISVLLIGILVIFLNISCENSQSLFHENSDDWKEYGDANWGFLNNELTGEIVDGSGYVMTNQAYDNFILEIEFKPDSTINSGVFIRCKNYDINPTDCYELNIWDLHPDQDSRTGAIVTKTVPLAFVETLSKWNTYKIKAEKNRIEVWVNGILTADLEDEGLAGGYIGLQAKGTGTIKFRNANIKTLED